MISIPALGANFFPVGKSGAVNRYIDKQVCEQVEGQECFDIGHKASPDYKDPRFHEVQTSMVDDTNKPIYKPKYNLSNCDSDDDCLSKYDSTASGCTSGDYVQHEKNTLVPGYSVYCIGIASYEQMEVKTVVENAALKASVEADDAQKAADYAALEAVAKDAKFGNKMIAFVSARIRTKTLSLADTKLVLNDYAAVISLLRAGSIPHAKSEVTAMTPDGTRVTQADKDALLAEINSYLGQ